MWPTIYYSLHKVRIRVCACAFVLLIVNFSITKGYNKENFNSFFTNKYHS